MFALHYSFYVCSALCSVKSFIQKDDYGAEIGTDHGYMVRGT